MQKGTKFSLFIQSVALVAAIFFVFTGCKTRSWQSSSGRLSEYQVETDDQKWFRIWLEEGSVWIGACQNKEDVSCTNDSAGVLYDDLRTLVFNVMHNYFERLLKDHEIRSTTYAGRSHKDLEETSLEADLNTIQQTLAQLQSDLQPVQKNLEIERKRNLWTKDQKRIKSLEEDEQSILLKIAKSQSELDSARLTLNNKRGEKELFKKSEFDRLGDVTNLIFERIVARERRVFRLSKELTKEELNKANFEELKSVAWQETQMVLVDGETTFQRVFDEIFSLLHERLEVERRRKILAKQAAVAKKAELEWLTANAAKIRHRFGLSCKVVWSCPDKENTPTLFRTLSTFQTPWYFGPVAAQDSFADQADMCREFALSQLSDQSFAFEIYRGVTSSGTGVSWDNLLRRCPSGPGIDRVEARVNGSEECLDSTEDNQSRFILCSELKRLSIEPVESKENNGDSGKK